MHGNRHHRHVEIAVDACDPVFIGRLGAGGPAGAFRVDDQLAACCHFFLGPLHHLDHDLATGAAIDRDHLLAGDIPAEDRDPHQFALEDVDRIVEPGQQRIGVPQRLVLGCQDVAALRDVLEPLHREGRAHDLFHQPVVRARPVLRDDEGLLARCKKVVGRQQDHLQDQAGIEQRIEEDRTEDDHRKAFLGRGVAASLTQICKDKKRCLPISLEAQSLILAVERRPSPTPQPMMPRA